MRCEKCQTENTADAKVCVRCGAELAKTEGPVMNEASASEAPASEAAPSDIVAPAPAMEASTPEETPASVTETSESAPETEKGPNPLKVLLGVFTKPLTTVSEEIPHCGNFQTASLMALIVLVVSVVLSVLAGAFTAIFSAYCLRTGVSCKVLDFGDLKYFKFGEQLAYSALSTIVLMALVAGVFYGTVRIFKVKKSNFWRMLAIVSLATLPMLLTNFVGVIVGGFASLVEMMNVVAAAIVAIGLIYAAVIFYEGVTIEAGVTSNRKAYYILISAAITLTVLAIVIWLAGDKLGLGTRFY